jgi:hypothetical protein
MRRQWLRIGSDMLSAHSLQEKLGIFENCEKQYVVCYPVQLPCPDLDSFAKKPVRFVEADR